MMSSVHYLSYYVFLEILSRCSLKIVDKSKLISKVCNEITYEAIFQQYQKKKTGTVYGYIIQSLYNCKHLFCFISSNETDNKSKKSTLALDFLPHQSQILASSDQGILCCITRDKGGGKYRFYVCKPTTKQVQMLPNPKLRYITDKVGLVVLQSNPLRYKIIRLSRLIENRWSNTYLCEIFDSKIWAWKQLEIELPFHTFMLHNLIFASCRFYLLLSNNQVLAFDLETEIYTIFNLPTLVIQMLDKVFPGTIKLVKYKGKLGLICEEMERNYEQWVMEDYNNHVWEKINKIDTEGAKKKEPYCYAVDIHNSNTALMKGYDFMFYNFEDLSVINVLKLDYGLAHPNDVYAFRSDHEPVNLRGGY